MTTTYRCTHSDHSMKTDNVGVLELAYDGCFLQEAHCVPLRWLSSQHLDCDIQVSLFSVPLPPTHRAKFTRTKVVLDSKKDERKSNSTVCFYENTRNTTIKPAILQQHNNTQQQQQQVCLLNLFPVDFPVLLTGELFVEQFGFSWGLPVWLTLFEKDPIIGYWAVDSSLHMYNTTHKILSCSGYAARKHLTCMICKLAT